MVSAAATRCHEATNLVCTKLLAWSNTISLSYFRLAADCDDTIYIHEDEDGVVVSDVPGFWIR